MNYTCIIIQLPQIDSDVGWAPQVGVPPHSPIGYICSYRKTTVSEQHLYSLNKQHTCQ